MATASQTAEPATPTRRSAWRRLPVVHQLRQSVGLQRGMLVAGLVLSGIFHLERQSVRPLSSRRSVDQDTGVEPVVSKKNPIPLTIPAGATRTNSVSIVTEMDLQSIQAAVNFNAPLAHSAILIKLQSPGPNPVELVLYDGTSLANASR